TLIVLPAAAVPNNVRVLSFVIASPTTPLSVEYELMVGAPGATVSIVTARAADAALTLAALSVAVAVKLCVASDRTPVVKLQEPGPFAVVVPRSVAPS